jgi:hypothetical protein
MNEDVKIKYKIKNDEIIYWIMFFVIVSVYALLSFLVNKEYSVIYLIIMEFIVLVVFLFYFFINIFRCKNFYRLCNEMKKNGIEINMNNCFIKIKRKDYRVKPVMQSIEVNAKTHFRSIEAYSVQTKDLFMLFFQLPDFGLFRRYIRPVIFKKNNIMIPSFMKNIYLIENYEKKEIENDICIKLNMKLNDIEYLVLPVSSDI